MKKLILLFLCLPFFAYAQDDNKYLEGAIPMVEGKVTFSTEINTPSMTKEQIFQTVLNWANKRYQPNEKMNARVLYQNEEKGSIAIGGEEYMVFSTSMLALDRTRIYYQMQILCENGKCDINMSRIRYWYDEARDGGEKYVAEEWITDKWALNKAKTKLSPGNGKFRKKTIDLKDELFKEIRAVLGDKVIELGTTQAPTTPQPEVTVAQPEIKSAPVTETNTTEATIAQATRMTITAGNDEQFEISKDCWGGFGELFGKKVAFCLINTQKTMGNLLMEQSESYKISFYTDNNSQPAIVVNCKKLMTQNINGEEAQKMNPNCAVGNSYNMYVGEILK